MNLRLLTVLSAVGLIAALIPAASAQPDDSSADVGGPETGQVVELPDAVGDHAVPLGTAIDPGTGLQVEGYAIFHHRDDHDGGPPGGNGGGDDTSSCFAFLAKDAEWKTTESWVVNTANDSGLTENFVFDNMAGDLQKWEDHVTFEIFGDGSTTTADLVADTENPDDVNEVYFGDVSSEGAIAVTIVWGIFSGPPFNRELVEWDMVFDHVDFDWSATGESDKMDFENIATHETGHAAGLGHPDDSCTEETMYAFADFGETKKRDLHDGDIAGISELYS